MNQKKDPFRPLPESRRDVIPEKHRGDVTEDIAKAGKKWSPRGKASASVRLASLRPREKTNPTKVYYFKDIVATIREPLVVLNQDLRVFAANRSFYKLFKVKQKETVGNLIYDLGNRQWDIPALRHLLETILPKKAVFNEYEVEHDFPSIGRRILLLNARRIPSPPKEALWILLAFEDVTERMRLERALQASEVRFRGAFETATDSMLLVDKTSGRVLNSNRAAQHTFSYSNQKLLKLNLWELDILKDRQHFEQISEELEKKGAVEISNKTVHTRGGGQLPADIYLMDRTGVIQCNIRDIAERKRAQEKLATSEAELRALFAGMTDVVIVYDTEGRYIKIAPTNPANLYRPPDEMQGMTLHDILPKEQADYIISMIREAIQKGQVVNGEYTLQVDGKEIWFSASASRLSDTTAILVAHDITERKRVVDKLEEERILLRTLVDNLPDRIYVKDVQGRKLIANLADWQASGGKRMEDVIGKTDFDTYPPELAEDYRALDKAVMDSGISNINREELGLDSQGNPVWVLSSKVPLRDGQGKVVGLVGIGHDITERKQREEVIQSRTEELSALYQLSRLLADANDLENVFELANRQAVESVHTTFACIALLEDGELVTRAVYPVRVLEHEFIIGGRQPITALPVCQRVLDKNEPVILQAGSPEVGSAEHLTLQLDFAQSVCLVPLWVGDASQNLNQALGLLILGEARGEEREPFTPEKIRLARSIGDQAAAAIRRLLLREQAGRRLQRLASLNEIDRTIASNFDLHLSLQMILKHVSEQLEADAEDVLVINDRMQTLEFAAGRGFRSPAMEGLRQRLGEGQAGQAVLTRHIVQIPDVAASGAVFAHPELMKAEGVAAYFAVPLITKGQIKGVLEVCHRTPLDPDAEWLDFLNTLAGQAAIAIDNVQLFDNLQRSTDELELAYDATIEGWSHALDLRDKETEGHTLRVTEMTVNLARTLGLGEKELVQVRWGGLLHDIGKMGVPDGILLKPGPLTAEEWVAMKKHPTFAYEMLAPIRYLRLALDIPYCHHEKWDGTGYPRGLKGEQIPLSARIFAVVDVWDALTSDRPYRKAWSEEKARQLIKTGAGTHFDPQVVKIFFSEHG
jgi:PAS domain S-box-containing protein/putative nucleotidyltransferase with HDIG domain